MSSALGPAFTSTRPVVFHVWALDRRYQSGGTSPRGRGPGAWGLGSPIAPSGPVHFTHSTPWWARRCRGLDLTDEREPGEDAEGQTTCREASNPGWFQHEPQAGPQESQKVLCWQSIF